jgi:hypothetical protein
MNMRIAQFVVVSALIVILSAAYTRIEAAADQGPASQAAQETPREGPARLAAIRKQLEGTVSKFEFTQGYDFRKQPDKLRPLMAAIRAQGFDTWDQMPRSAESLWDAASLGDLERTLEVAGDVGLKVWATLIPPSESETVARMPLPERQEYYYSIAERFARLAAKHPHFVAFTCDDFSLNNAFFTPPMLSEMARRWRAICPRLAFLPLLYYPGVSKDFFTRYGDYVDGIVFHFRSESYPPAVIPAYDPKSFDMYGDVMRYELKRVREMAGEHTVICGIYIGYYRGGWGVLAPDGQQPTTEHVIRDAAQKVGIAHPYADGVRVYGLGIDHEAYHAMGDLARQWRTAGDAWGAQRGDPESHLARWQAQPAGLLLGTLLRSDQGLGHDVSRSGRWPQWELLRDLERGEFDPAQAAARYPLLVVSGETMLPAWPLLLEGYVRAGGTMALEFVPGWRLDSRATSPTEPKQRIGDGGVLTLQFASLSGVAFHYEPRGLATRWRVVKRHPLTEGLGEPGVWQATSAGNVKETYPYLVHPVEAAGGEVLIEVEHERCPYNGLAYVRQGTLAGIHPLLTVRKVGQGQVVRHYAAVNLETVLGKAYPQLVQNLLTLAAKARTP